MAQKSTNKKPGYKPRRSRSPKKDISTKDTREFKLAFTMKEKGLHDTMNIAFVANVKTKMYNGMWFAWDDFYLGIGESIREAMAEYTADRLGVIGYIERANNKELFHFAQKNNGNSGYRIEKEGPETDAV
jgi:hypothetical protein